MRFAGKSGFLSARQSDVATDHIGKINDVAHVHIVARVSGLFFGDPRRAQRNALLLPIFLTTYDRTRRTAAA